MICFALLVGKQRRNYLGLSLGYIKKNMTESAHFTRLTCMVFSQFFSLLMPALLIVMSRRPNMLTVVWNASVPQKSKGSVIDFT